MKPRKTSPATNETRSACAYVAVPLEVLRERDVKGLEDVQAGEVAECIVVADDRGAYPYSRR